MTVHARIRELRQQLGLDEDELALQAGLSVATIRHIEQGNMQPNGSTLDRLARALRTTAAELGKPEEW